MTSSARKRVYLGRALSIVGDSAGFTALTIGVAQAGVAPLIISAGLVLGVLAQIVTGPVTVWLLSTRWSEFVAKVSTLVAAAAQFSVLAVLLDGSVGIVLFLVSRLVYGATGAVTQVSLGAQTRAAFPTAGELLRVNSRLRAVRYLFLTLTPIVFAIVSGGTAWAWFVSFDALSFLLTASLLPRISTHQQQTRPQQTTGAVAGGRQILSDLRSALSSRWFRPMVVASIAYCALIVPVYTIAGPVTMAAAHAAGTWAIMLAGRSVGGLLASLTAPRIPWVTSPVALGAAMVVELGGFALLMNTSIGVVLVVLFAAAGMAEGYFNVGYGTRLQVRPTPEELPRFLAIDSTVSTAAMPVGYLLIGGLLQAGQPELIILLCGAGVLLAAGYLVRSAVGATAERDLVDATG